MAPLTKATLFLIGAAITKLASASAVHAFPNAGCDALGYYQTITASNDNCTKEYLSDSDFKTVGTNSALYEAWFRLEAPEASGCALVIGKDGATGRSPPCGECVISLHNPSQCIQAQLPKPFYAWECCGQQCLDQCGSIPAKRSIAEAVEALEAREVEANQTTPDIANLKNRAPAAGAPLSKRDKCTFNKDGGLYSQVGSPQRVSDTINTCADDKGCPQMFNAMVESSFSNEFDVSETTEAGFFEIVSESVSFGYSATWEKSQTKSTAITANFSKGQSGYITWAPLYQCQKGTFSGDCKDIPTGGSPRSACVPETKAGGEPSGEINIVTAA